MHALVVDDEPDVRRYLARVLMKHGFSVAEAADADAALETIRRSVNFDLALVDLHLPGMDGNAFVRAVRKTGLNPSLKIMTVTGNPDTSQVKEALASGADEYLMKPLTESDLLAKLKILSLL